jgi:hypothetical protein
VDGLRAQQRVGPAMRIFLLFLLLSAQLLAQQVEPAPEFESKFNRQQGWTGADGTYSYPLKDGGVLWSFSDTFFGPVIDGKRVDFTMVNNSQIVQRGEDLTFLESQAFVPPNRRGWFWMWDGTYDGEFKVLLGHFEKDGGGIFGFKQVGLWYARAMLHSDRLVIHEYAELPFFQNRDDKRITFGSAVYREGGWDYILGIHDLGIQRSCILARVPAGRIGLPGVWRFYDGKGWSRDPWKAALLFDGASMESSVHRTRDGGYLYVASLDRKDRIVARYAPSVAGPWSEPKDVYRPPEVQGDVFTYNAKAHPELSTGDRLLISYNVNTRNLTEVIERADIYRPRFIWWTPSNLGWLP